jgi:hypothetical protein
MTVMTVRTIHATVMEHVQKVLILRTAMTALIVPMTTYVVALLVTEQATHVMMAMTVLQTFVMELGDV